MRSLRNRKILHPHVQKSSTKSVDSLNIFKGVLPTATKILRKMFTGKTVEISTYLSLPSRC